MTKTHTWHYAVFIEYCQERGLSIMAFTEVSEEGWFSRIGSSIKGILFGIVIFALGFPVLFWNEGRAVRRAQTLAEGRGAVVSVAADKVDQANEGKLVHLSGMATTEDTLTDPDFQISAEKAIRLSRSVEMYQWVEKKETKTKKKAGGKKQKITTYTYAKEWSSSEVQSGNFKEKGHDNPGPLPYDNDKWVAEKVSLGAFTLGSSLSSRIGGAKAISLTDADRAKLPSSMARRMQVNGSEFYMGKNPSSPEIGDVRISFKKVDPAQVTVVAVQTGDSFQPYVAKAGGSEIFECVMGEKTSDQMFDKMEADNTMMTWILRAIGFFMMLIGLNMIFRPLVVVADVLPFLGSMVEAGVGLLSFGIAAPLALITIAIGWIAYRPLLGIGILVVAGGIGFAIISKLRSK